MKGRIAALVMLVGVLIFSVSAAFGGPLLFEDKFTDLDPAWGSPSDIINVKDGKLVISPEVNQSQALLNQGTLLPNDMVASVAMSFVKADAPSYGSGLVFWAKDYSEYYAVLVNAEGWFAVQRHVAGRYLLPVAWREFDGIKKEAGAVNQLRVVTKGTQAKVFINDKEAISFKGQPPQGGSLIGVKASSGSQAQNSVTFTDLKVMQP